MSSVDVVVPCYRYGHFLRQCVESVLSQSGVDVRILIIDDASPDNTSEVASDLVRQDTRVNFSRHSTNRGHIATYNEGIEWASADYMLLLSADDYLLPDALSRSAGLMDAHPEVGFTFAKAVVVREGDTETLTPRDASAKAGWHILTGPEFVEFSGACDIVPVPTAVVRTELQKRLGGYRADLPHSGDMEMWLRFAAHASVGMYEGYLAAYRRHSGNMSLSYTSHSWLPDLQQRKAAFDTFFQTYGQVFPDARELHRKLFRLLSYEAIKFASIAFNERNMDVSDQLLEYARELCPQYRLSLPWLKLAVKRQIGPNAWLAVQPIFSSIRPTNMQRKQPGRAAETLPEEQVGTKF